MAFDLLAIAQDGYITQGIGGGDITLLEVSAIQVVVADEEYQAVVQDDIITVIIEDDIVVTVSDTDVNATVDSGISIEID